MLTVEQQSSLRQIFSHLPCGEAPDVFTQLWSGKRLRFNGLGDGNSDVIDELSARLACATLTSHKRLLITLPDRQSRRIALLFGTTLIIHALNRLSDSQTGGQVLYFGSNIGIRTFLSQTSVRNLPLDSVFPEALTVDRGRNGKRRSSVKPDETDKMRLPLVLCCYSPADPVSIVQHNPSDWIAIDLSDGKSPPWLPPLLSHANTHNLPVIAWCQNHLSEGAAEFTRMGCHVFRWPQLSEIETGITPILLEGPGVENIAKSLWEAGRHLIEAARSGTGQLSKDAIRLGWRMLRSLETLSVPLNLYEAESRSYWGLTSISRLQEGLHLFAEAISPVYPRIAASLEQAYAQLETASYQLQVADPPIWIALTELCVKDVPDGAARAIIFPSRARKQMFSFALLSRLNITEEDLRELRTYIFSLKEFHQSILAMENGNAKEAEPETFLRGVSVLPVLVGVPSLFSHSYLESVLRYPEVEVLIYPHQGSLLTQRAVSWKESLQVDLEKEMELLPRLGGHNLQTFSYNSTLQRIILRGPEHYKTGRKGLATLKSDMRPSLWQPNDPVEEVKWLLQTDSEVEEDGLSTALGLSTEDSDEQTLETNSDTVWVKEVCFVRLKGDLQVFFPKDETVQVIVPSPEGDKVEERYIRALRVGDRLLFIHGQRRQSLYDLIVSRIHKNPAMELHLALIQRWQEDFRQAYNRKGQKYNQGVEGLLRALQSRGSKLISSQTLRLWLRGQTLCPDDIQDLQRLAEELELTFVRQYYRRIHGAAQRLAGVHRSLAIKLNSWLRRGAPSDSGEDVLDSDLSLSFQDFRDSLIILQVESVESRFGLFARNSLGQLEREPQ